MTDLNRGPNLTNAPFSRRHMLQRCGAGFGALALADLLHGTPWANPSAQPSNIPQRAKHVIHLFMGGGPSHVDTFDPKPALKEYAGKSLPESEAMKIGEGGASGVLLPSPFQFVKSGDSGLEISEVFPHLAKQADKLCVIRSMHCDVPSHEQATLLLHCGDNQLSRPSVGAWVTYGLGVENEQLPAFVVLCPRKVPSFGPAGWQSSFLPANFQGTRVDPMIDNVEKLIPNIRSLHATQTEQRLQLDLLEQFNRLHQQSRQEDPRLEARLRSFELAFQMQTAATDVFDLSNEPQSIRELYGEGLQANQLIMARRLVEQGVRFVQVWFGPDFEWDHHGSIGESIKNTAAECDQAIAGLLADLEQRGLLSETLVIWGGEFGRTPTAQVADAANPISAESGRDHHHLGFSAWLAGGGVKGGYAHGATDDFGMKAVDKPVHVHDLHATILHLLGFDHKKLTYPYAGRDFRLTDVYGNVVKEIIA